jgi:putative membrane protein
MTRAAPWLLGGGLLLFVIVLASHDLGAVFGILAVAGWGLVGVTLFHLLPLVLDGAAIRVLQPRERPRALADAVLVRWIGESANSLMPGGALGGPLLMIRQLLQRGAPPAEAVAAITVSTTLQSFAQIVFALLGVALLGGRVTRIPATAYWPALTAATGALAVCLATFYLLQRRGLFARLTRLGRLFAGKRDWSQLIKHAEGIDAALNDAYGRRAQVWQSFLLSLIAWLVGTGEVWLILHLLGTPVGWGNALVLESLGQAIRSAAFAIPGALGVQEGGYLLLAPLAGVGADVALALSLAKRTRELLLGVPGVAYLYFSERAFRRRTQAAAAGS